MVDQDGIKKRFPAELAGKASRKGLWNIFFTVEGVLKKNHCEWMEQLDVLSAAPIHNLQTPVFKQSI